MSLCGSGGVEAEASVGGSFPSVLICTRGGTGRCFGGGLGIVRGVQLGQGHGGRAVTLGASTCESACCGRSGILRCLVAVGMTGCIGIGILVAVGATGTGMSGVALCGASGSSHYLVIIVSQCSYCGLCSEDCITDGTVCAFRETGGSTGGRNSLVGD